mmetsp:Transcript_10233/g.19171  ORF Transcript_10233/g.19171 Transcript_10233/m.19171 type:complete len:485 (-) Transcript_10233:917-2371(-)
MIFTKSAHTVFFLYFLSIQTEELQAFHLHPMSPTVTSSRSCYTAESSSYGRTIATTTYPYDTHCHGPTRYFIPSRSLSVRPSSSTSLNGVLNTAVLSASLSATAKLLSSIGIGALATPVGPKQFGNILDSSAVSALSKLTYWLFQPCFLLCGVASTLAKACSGTGGLPTSALMVLPLAALVQISLGSLAAKCITTKKFGIRPLFLGIDIDDDAGASDIQMCTTFANSGPLPTILSDALFRGELLSDVAACISFYLLVWSPLFWSLGKIILGLNETDNALSANGTSKVSKVVRQVKSFLSPPVIGSLMGIIIGSTSILRNAFLTPGAPLAPVFGAFRTFGVAYLPAAVLVLAGSLVKKDASTTDSESKDTKSSSSVHPKTIISLLFSRFILSPLLALTTVRLLLGANLLPVDNARTLAVVTFTLLMEGCMPPAQNSVVMLQLADQKVRAAKMAKLLTVIYALSSIPVTLLLSGCLGMSGILNVIV